MENRQEKARKQKTKIINIKEDICHIYDMTDESIHLNLSIRNKSERLLPKCSVFSICLKYKTINIYIDAIFFLNFV